MQTHLQCKEAPEFYGRQIVDPASEKEAPESTAVLNIVQDGSLFHELECSCANRKKIWSTQPCRGCIDGQWGWMVGRVASLSSEYQMTVKPRRCIDKISWDGSSISVELHLIGFISCYIDIDDVITIVSFNI